MKTVSREDVKKFAKLNGLIYYETSSMWDRDEVEKFKERGGVSALIQ